MKALVLSGDDSILVEGTRSQARMLEYARLFDGLHIVVASHSSFGRPESGGLSSYPAAGRNALTRMLRLGRIGSAVCRTVRPDVISTQDAGGFGLVGYLLARWYRIPLQVQVHTDIISPFYRRASWREWLHHRLACFVLPRATCIRVVSKRVGDAIAERLAISRSRIRVLPIGTDVAGVRSAPRQTETDERFRDFGFRMIAAGRFVDREKDFSLLMDAMVEICGVIPRPVLVLVGDGPDRRRYERRIRSRGIGASVVLEPWREDLPSFFKSFDLFLVASRYEGWGRVCVEAAAAGLPVITTDVGLAGELLVDGVSAVVVPVGDQEAMSRAILDLYANPAKRRELVRAAQATIERVPYRTMSDYYREYVETMRACIPR
jgi:glycosyltransferase involved in cell wall biosynthesis